MTADPVTLVVGALLVGAVICAIVYVITVDKLLSRARKESSRFPMFAARGRLVRLIAEGQMDESNVAWQRQYTAVNSLLDMNKSLHAFDLAWKLLLFQVRLRKDPAVRHEFEAMKRQTAAAAERCPDFRDACMAAENGLHHMVRRRSAWSHLFAVWVLVVALMTLSVTMKGLLAMLAAIGGKKREPKAIRPVDVVTATERPSARELLEWQMTEAVPGPSLRAA